MKKFASLGAMFLLSGCFATGEDWSMMDGPSAWFSAKEDVKVIAPEELQNWWLGFEDPVLNEIVALALEGSPERKIAESRILEARGERRTTRSALFPEIGGSASAGREETSLSSADDFYDAGFDASFEIDIFGKNRKRDDAALSQIEGLEADYQDVSLTLIAEVARTYVELREFEKQVEIAKKNLDIQEQSLKLVEQLLEAGEGPLLDVERAAALVNTTRASIPEFQRLSQNAQLRLTILTGKMPSEIAAVVVPGKQIPGDLIKPVLTTPADVLALRPDIRAASANLSARTSLAEAATAEIFPTFTLGGFFGVADSALASSVTIWNVVAGAAMPLLDFGRVEGQIDAARAREAQAYQLYRLTVLQAVTEVETALNDYARINERRISLQKAFENSRKSFDLSSELYEEGEVAFLDVLDAQRTLNDADAALITAQAAQAQALIRLYKSLGVY